jgi:hypothetical protein
MLLCTQSQTPSLHSLPAETYTHTVILGVEYTKNQD